MVKTKRKRNDKYKKKTAKGILNSKIMNSIKPFTFNQLEKKIYKLQEQIYNLERKNCNSDSEKKKNLKKIVKLLEEFSYLYNEIYYLPQFNNLDENILFTSDFIERTIQSYRTVINRIAYIYINHVYNDLNIATIIQNRDQIIINHFIDENLLSIEDIDENLVYNISQAYTEYYENNNIEALRQIIHDIGLDDEILYHIINLINQDDQINYYREFVKWKEFIRIREENNSINYHPKEHLRFLIYQKKFLYKEFLSQNIIYLLDTQILSDNQEEQEQQPRTQSRRARIRERPVLGQRQLSVVTRV